MVIEVLSDRQSGRALPDDLLLSTSTARKLYAQSRTLPILDYHGHLDPAVLAADAPYRDLAAIWLDGDHYKWRAMRLNGVPERLCSGGAPPFERFLAWARTLPLAVRNPLYEWSHLELEAYFGISDELTPNTAGGIWEATNELLATDDFRPLALLRRRGVETVATTDDPADDLSAHARLATNPKAPRVVPSYRPDAALHLGDTASFNQWVDRLAETADTDIVDLRALLDALYRRHESFHARGCRASDHGIERAYDETASDAEAKRLFDGMRRGINPVSDALARWRGYLMRHFAAWNREREWVMMLHLGARRNNNSRILSSVGLDAGCDSVGDQRQGQALNRFLDSLDRAGQLPRTVLFNSNPRDNLLFATVCGNFFEDGVIGKVQHGPAWWFLDTADGIRAQLDAISSVGLFSRFVGMTTDSRSILSFVRHDYFRRVVCDMVGLDIELGRMPPDEARARAVLEGLFYRNTASCFGWETTC